MAEKNKSFEENIKRLEEIVGLLENGNCSLDESMKLYKEGVTLSEICHGQLDDAKQVIEKITPDGKED